MEQERDFEQEAASFREEHPEVDQLPDEVAQAWAEGKPLNRAWEESREQQEPEPPAAVAPVTGQGGAEQPRKDDFLAGLETEAW